MRIILLLLLLMSAGSIWQTLRVTPAFNPRMMEETVVGNGMLIAREAMYDPASYDFQRGFGFLMADLVISEETEGRDETASFETSLQRAVRAQDALQDALRNDPANAHAWAAMGWAHIRQGEGEMALEALQTSWRLAPYNRALADTRINLISVLAELDDAQATLVGPFKENILRDADVLAKHDKSTFDFYMETSLKLSRYIQKWRES